MPGQDNSPKVAQIEIKVNGTDVSNDIMDKLVEVEVENSLYLPSMFVLRFYDDENATLIDGTVFAQGAAVQISFKANSTATAYTAVFKGEITALEPDFGRDAVPMLVVRGYDRSHRLHRGTKTKVYVNAKDSDIVSQIASAAGLSATVDATTEVYKHVFQYGVSDWTFIHERARRNGYEVSVDDRTLYFRKVTTPTEEQILTWNETLVQFQPRYSLAKQVNKVTVKGWDPQTKQAIVGEASSSPAPAVGIGNWGGALAQSAFSAAEVLEVRHPVVSQGEATKMAQAILDEINAGFLQADGLALGNPAIKPGIKVDIQKVGTKFSGKYIVTTVRHIYNASDGMTTAFTVQGARAQTISDLIDQSMVEKRMTELWGGIVTAVVTNNNDTEKNMGRVKVKFPWLDDQLESNWARMTATGAGASRGFMWLPEVNDEVLVAFEHGDFDYPYVVGALWNGQDASPETTSTAVVSGKVEVRTLKTRAGHIIRLTDTSGSEKIEIIGAKTKTKVEMDEANQKLTITSQKDVEVNATGNLTLKASGNVDLSGVNVTIKASGNLEAKATGMGKVEASGIMTVKGSMVNIN